MSVSRKIATNSFCALVQSKSRATTAMAASVKLIFVVVGLICAVVTPKANAGPVAITEKCMSETGVTKSMLVDFMQGQNDSRPVKCFFKCTMMATGCMNPDGSFNMDAMARNQPPALYKVASTTCANIQASDPCDKAYAHVACLRDNAKEEMMKTMQ